MTACLISVSRLSLFGLGDCVLVVLALGLSETDFTALTVEFF